MKNSEHLSKNAIHQSRHLYEQGFSFLAFLLMLLAFAFAGGVPEDMRPSSTRMLALPERTAPQQKNWRESESAWLTQKATDLTRQFQENGIQQVTIYSRIKSEDSALQKAQKKNVAISELNDLYGLRVVVANELDVYRCLNMICDNYPVIPGTMKNYIVAPKASGYQSVHVVTQMDERKVEFQLRTESMHLSAEAEHEAYKIRTNAQA